MIASLAFIAGACVVALIVSFLDPVRRQSTNWLKRGYKYKESDK